LAEPGVFEPGIAEPGNFIGEVDVELAEDAVFFLELQHVRDDGEGVLHESNEADSVGADGADLVVVVQRKEEQGDDEEEYEDDVLFEEPEDVEETLHSFSGRIPKSKIKRKKQKRLFSPDGI